MEDSRQNPGETEGKPLTPAPAAKEDDALEHVLDAWSSEPSSRQRYDRLRLERRDGQALELLIDSDTARDLGDKLTIVAARARHRTRGAAGVPVDKSVDPGDAEDLARARKVLELAASSPDKVVLSIMADEFKASREDVAKAHAMLDEQRAKHVRELQQAKGEGMIRADQNTMKLIDDLRAELESVKADRANLIAEAAQRDIEDGERGEHRTIDLSDPSEPAPP